MKNHAIKPSQNHLGLLFPAFLFFILFLTLPHPADAASHPTVYKGVDYSRIYSYDYYIRRYPAIGKYFNYDDRKILEHFVLWGTKQEKQGIATFDEKSYRYGNPGLRRTYGTDYQKYYIHYMKWGYKEASRKGTYTGIKTMQKALTVYEGIDYSPVYSYDYYTKRYPGIAKTIGDDDSVILRHFVLWGMQQKKIGKDPVLYPEAAPGSEVWGQYLRKRLYPAGTTLSSSYLSTPMSSAWNSLLLKEIAGISNGGGYAANNTGMLAFNSAFGMNGNTLVINRSKARPSFCSGAAYLVLLSTLQSWDTKSLIPKNAWTNLRPYAAPGMAYPYQDDGVGAWGRANSNGPGMAVLIKKLGAGRNYYIGNRSEYSSDAAYWSVWGIAEPGDFLKIFRDNEIGAKEKGHMVVYLGRKYAVDENGARDDLIYYWSSQKATNGFGIASCRASAIYRGVLTKITAPDRFASAGNLSPTSKDSWLASLLGSRRADAEEMKSHI